MYCTPHPRTMLQSQNKEFTGLFTSSVSSNSIAQLFWTNCSAFYEQKQCGVWFATNYSLKYKLPCGFSKGVAYWRSYIYKVGLLSCEVLKYKSAVFIRHPYNLQRALCSVIDLVCFSLRLQPKVNNRDTAATGDYGSTVVRFDKNWTAECILGLSLVGTYISNSQVICMCWGKLGKQFSFRSEALSTNYNLSISLWSVTAELNSKNIFSEIWLLVVVTMCQVNCRHNGVICGVMRLWALLWTSLPCITPSLIVIKWNTWW